MAYGDATVVYTADGQVLLHRVLLLASVIFSSLFNSTLYPMIPMLEVVMVEAESTDDTDEVYF